MYDTVSNFLLQKVLDSKKLSKDEYEMANYNLQVILINTEKVATIYFVAFITQVFWQTIIMHLSFLLLRNFAGGWHAAKSFFCTVTSVAFFVGLPKIAFTLTIVINSTSLFILCVIPIYTIIKYSPADTDQNPFTSATNRKFRKTTATVIVMILLSLAFFTSNFFRIPILLGIYSECLLIHPIFYKLTKRSYNNYEKYEDKAI